MSLFRIVVLTLWLALPAVAVALLTSPVDAINLDEVSHANPNTDNPHFQLDTLATTTSATRAPSYQSLLDTARVLEVDV
ncbi:hypothetical protein ASPCAL01057 [Aspergillus calidoustus]|uniref:Uncharacterized protein n=1 Tax=Aspergillus calidoustus TaxID=454130 RepID=A0A0U5FQD7_ASPCI|nr:hypothetical protein ASPCAL01057 [Aspergillus calidoustus]